MKAPSLKFKASKKAPMGKFLTTGRIVAGTPLPRYGILDDRDGGIAVVHLPLTA